jgi:hypothetical protein
VLERVGRETIKIGKDSLSGQCIPNSTVGFSNPKTENKRHCCARVLGFCRKSVHEKVGRETIKIGKDSLSWQRIFNSTEVLESEDREQVPLLCTCPTLLQKSVHQKVGRETIKIGKDSLFTQSSGHIV